MSALSDNYAKIFKACTLRPQHVSEIKALVKRIESGRARYETVSKATGVPWWIIGLLHAMECSCRFDQHLHNGDSLTRRTVNEPKGRPTQGAPPFTWEASAEDALRHDKLDRVTDWSTGPALVVLENYNGTGYRRRGVPSPYLWSYTSAYSRGKYVRDGIYDPNAVSQQPGCAALMKQLGAPCSCGG